MKINLASTRLAFVLISLLLILIILSAIIPQQGLADEQIVNWRRLLGSQYRIIETLALDRIYYTPTFFVILGLLAINLLAGNIRRFKRVYRTQGSLLRARQLGSILFHLSLLLIIAAVILNYLYKYDGVLALTEGQQVADRPASYFREFRGALQSRPYGRFRIRLEKLDPDYSVAEAMTTAALVRLWDDRNHSNVIDTARTNRPARLDGLEIHFGQITGYSPELVVLDTSGRRLFGGFVRLANQEQGGKLVARDHYELSQPKLSVEMMVDRPTSSPDSVLYRIAVHQEDTTLFSGVISEKDTIRAGDYSVALPRLRRWCYLNVVTSPYLSLVFIGFWSGLAGLTIGWVPRLLNRETRQ